MSFVGIVAEYEQALVRHAARHLAGDIERARDAVQETFMRLHQEGPETLDGRLRPWLYRVCRQRAIDLARKHRPVNVDPAALDVHRPDPSARDPAAGLEADERRAALAQAMAALPKAEREAVLLKFQDDLSYKEIAEATGRTVDHVGVLIHRGIRRLRAALV